MRSYFVKKAENVARKTIFGKSPLLQWGNQIDGQTRGSVIDTKVEKALGMGVEMTGKQFAACIVDRERLVNSLKKERSFSGNSVGKRGRALEKRGLVVYNKLSNTIRWNSDAFKWRGLCLVSVKFQLLR